MLTIISISRLLLQLPFMATETLLIAPASAYVSATGEVLRDMIR